MAQDSFIITNNNEISTAKLASEASRKGQPCPFCAIANGNGAAKIFFESEQVLALLDHRPIAEGHTLVIPKQHFSDVTQIPQQLGGELHHIVGKVVGAQRSDLRVAGAMVLNNNLIDQHVSHYHIHVIPRRVADGISLAKGQSVPSGSRRLLEVADLLKAAIQ